MTDPIATPPRATGAAGAAAAAAKPAQPGAPATAKLRQAAQQFEAVFLRQMIGSMRGASDGDGLFDSSATQQFRDMGDAKLAEQMAAKGALHIADMLVRQYGARLAHGSGAASAASAAAAAATTTAAATAATPARPGAGA